MVDQKDAMKVVSVVETKVVSAAGHLVDKTADDLVYLMDLVMV